MFRAASQPAGSRWIKAIALSFQCSKQMIRNDLHRKDGDLKLNTEVLNQFSRLLDDEIELNDELKDEHEIEREHFIDQGKRPSYLNTLNFEVLKLKIP